MTRVKIRKIGNSSGAIFPKSVLDALKVVNGDEVEFTPTETGIAITRCDADIDRLMEDAERIMDEDRDVLRALSK
ncbi:MAG: AbrB/MazE/SpoVT family DNA-binding domain-containing protein [Hyphomonadaceae bacterium]